MPSKFLGVPLKIAGRRPAIFQKTLLFMNPPWDVTYECPSRCQNDPTFLPSFRSYIDRALTFKSEGCEFEPCRGRELYQKNRVIFLIIEEQLSMLKFFRLCMMVTFLMSPLSKRKTGKIFPCLLFQKGRTGKAKDPPPLLNYKLKRMNSQKSRKINK